MSKIPKNLSDKDMLKNFVEEPTLESMFMEAGEKMEKKAAKRAADEHPGKDIRIAYLTQDVIDKIGKMLLELKVDLYKEGIVDYRMNVHREGKNIIRAPVERNNK